MKNPADYRAEPRPNCKNNETSYSMDYDAQGKEILNPEILLNCPIGQKVTGPYWTGQIVFSTKT